MKVILFGANGLAGSAILHELLKAGHQVTAFVRTPAKIKEQHNSLQVVAGDVLNIHDVRNALPTHEAVVSAISEGPTIVHQTQSKGVGNIIKAMEEKSLQRIVAMGSIGILQLNNQQLVRDVDYPAEYYPLSEEQYKVYQQLQQSSLQWTQVCPPMIVDAKANGNYITQIDVAIEGKAEVAAGNIGAFIAQELKDKKFLQTRVALANA